MEGKQLSWPSRTALIGHLRHPARFAGMDRQMVRSKVVRNHHWYIDRDAAGRRHIGLDVLYRGGVTGPGWHFTGLTDEFYLYVWDCPLDLIEQASDVGGIAAAWRCSVREYWTSMEALPKAAAGVLITWHCAAFRLVERAGRNWKARCELDGAVALITAAEVAGALRASVHKPYYTSARF